MTAEITFFQLCWQKNKTHSWQLTEATVMETWDDRHKEGLVAVGDDGNCV